VEKMRMLTFIVLFLTAGFSYVISWWFIERDRRIIKEKGIIIFVISLGLFGLDYSLTIMPMIFESHSHIINLTKVFFWKHFWFFILSVIFLKHVLIQEKNFGYYFFIPVFFSVLLVSFFETIILLDSDELNEYFISDFVGWVSYFGVFGGIVSGLLFGTLKTVQKISLSLKKILTLLFYILFLGLCSLLPAYAVSFFIPKESFFHLFIVPVFVYVISFIIFGEIKNFMNRRGGGKKC